MPTAIVHRHLGATGPADKVLEGRLEAVGPAVRAIATAVAAGGGPGPVPAELLAAGLDTVASVAAAMAGTCGAPISSASGATVVPYLGPPPRRWWARTQLEPTGPVATHL